MIQSKIAKHFPEPDGIALAHSQKLMSLLTTEIAKQGPITFARYMELALYAPGLGYYSGGAHKLGPAGDFVTAPEISSLFSRCIAKQCRQVLQMLGHGDILELGAGSGIMAADLLLELETEQTLPEHYYILEVSADLKERQQQLFKEKIPQLLERIVWLDSLPQKITGVILANEVLDALPVHKLKICQGELEEIYVNAINNQLQFESYQASQNLKKQVSALNITATDNYEFEVNLSLQPLLASLSDILTQGLVLLIDYGFPRHEFYHPERHMGTIMCHYRHRAHSDPLIYPGLQDITAHVDFTAVAEAAESNGLTIAGFTNQANFLLSCGIADLLQMQQDPVIQFQLTQQLKKLVLPNEMGEIFKAMALTRDFDYPLIGFNLSDLRHKL